MRREMILIQPLLVPVIMKRPLRVNIEHVVSCLASAKARLASASGSEVGGRRGVVGRAVFTKESEA